MALERGSLGQSKNSHSLMSDFDYDTGLTGSDAKSSLEGYVESSVNPSNNVDPRVAQAIAEENHNREVAALRARVDELLAMQEKGDK